MTKIICVAMLLVFTVVSPVLGGTMDKVGDAIDYAGWGSVAVSSCANATGNASCKRAQEYTDYAAMASSAKTLATAATNVASVAGSSGAASMSTLTSSGSTLTSALNTLGVGGRTVLGVSVTSAPVAGILGAGSGGVAAASLMNKYVYNGDTEADEAARVGTYAGAVAGTAGSLTAVGATGTAGFSAAGITSGLAGIGATVGGGMAAGTALVVAAPVAAAVAVSLGVYWLFK